MIIPDVIVAFAWFAFLDPFRGTLNNILSTVGLGRPDWGPRFPLFSIIVFNTWRGTAFSALLFSSALASIPPSYLEAAEVSGAGWWRKFRDITIPLLRGHIADRSGADHALDLQQLHALPDYGRRSGLKDVACLHFHL